MHRIVREEEGHNQILVQNEIRTLEPEYDGGQIRLSLIGQICVPAPPLFRLADANTGRGKRRYLTVF